MWQRGDFPQASASCKNNDLGSSFLGLLESEFSLFDEAELDTSLRKKGNDGLLAFSNNEHIGRTGSESVTIGVLNVSDVEAAGMFLDVLENTDSTDVVTTDDEHLSAILILDEALDLAGLKVQL